MGPYDQSPWPLPEEPLNHNRPSIYAYLRVGLNTKKERTDLLYLPDLLQVVVDSGIMGTPDVISV
jgi:hypothetical protein